MRQCKKSSDQGFTLPELLVVIIVIGILAGISIAAFDNSRQTSITNACKTNYQASLLAISSYQSDNNGALPNTLNDLVPSYLNSNLVSFDRYTLMMVPASTTDGYSLAITDSGSNGTGTLISPTLTASITAESGNGSIVTYTANNSFTPGQAVTVTGITPGTFNLTNATIASATSTQFTVSSAVTGSATSTGTAYVGSVAAATSAVSGNGTTATFTGINNSLLGTQLVGTSGFAPSGFNVSGVNPGSVTGTSFTLSSSGSGTPTSAGTVFVQSPLILSGATGSIAGNSGNSGSIVGTISGPQSVTPTFGASAASGATSITVSSASGIQAGMAIMGAPFAAGTRVTNVNGTTLTISPGLTGAASSGTSITLLPVVNTYNSGTGALALYSSNLPTAALTGNAVVFASKVYGLAPTQCYLLN